MKILIFLFLVIFLINQAHAADTIIVTLYIGGEDKGDVIITRDQDNYMLDSPISFGSCNSKNLNDFGAVRIEKDKVFVEVQEKCLEEKEVDLRRQKQEKVKPEKSKSFFLNYSATIGNHFNPYFSFGAGLFIYDTFFYSDWSFEKTEGLKGIKHF
jgi:hypothetical protein